MSDYDEGYSAGKDELWERIAELEAENERATVQGMERAAEILVQSNFYTVDEMVKAIREEIDK